MSTARASFVTEAWACVRLLVSGLMATDGLVGEALGPDRRRTLYRRLRQLEAIARRLLLAMAWVHETGSPVAELATNTQPGGVSPRPATPVRATRPHGFRFSDPLPFWMRGYDNQDRTVSAAVPPISREIAGLRHRLESLAAIAAAPEVAAARLAHLRRRCWKNRLPPGWIEIESLPTRTRGGGSRPELAILLASQAHLRTTLLGHDPPPGAPIWSKPAATSPPAGHTYAVHLDLTTQPDVLVSPALIGRHRMVRQAVLGGLTGLSVAAAAGCAVAQPEPAPLVPPSQITVTYVDVPEAAQIDFESAAAIWESCLVSEVPITIRVTWIPRGPTGFAYQNSVRNLDGLPVADVWYPTALANAITGERLASGDDINVFLSARTNWYFASETPIGEDQTDFINVALHEIAHGIGLTSTSFVPWDGEPIASLGLPNDFSNYFDYSFELHTQDGTPSLYDSLIRLADGRTLLDFPNPSVELTLALANPTVHFEGEAATRANQGFPVGVTPLNITHIPAFPRQPNPIMLSNSGVGETIHTPDKILLGMLEDLGWDIAEGCGA